MLCVCCFFFQAEDGIRDLYVTGVQTCALPISVLPLPLPTMPARSNVPFFGAVVLHVFRRDADEHLEMRARPANPARQIARYHRASLPSLMVAEARSSPKRDRKQREPAVRTGW